MSTRIAVSLRGQMRALASQGIFATDCYEQLKSILLQKFGPEHAALLAEPQHNAEGNSVDWYAEGNGPAVPLSDLAEPEAQALRARYEMSRGNAEAALEQLEKIPSTTVTSEGQRLDRLGGRRQAGRAVGAAGPGEALPDFVAEDLRGSAAYRRAVVDHQDRQAGTCGAIGRCRGL